MKSFRSARDEYMDIEDRWRVIFAREAHLNKREQQIQQREKHARRLMTAFHYGKERDTKTPTTKNSSSSKLNNNNKDYAQFAVRPGSPNIST